MNHSTNQQAHQPHDKQFFHTLKNKVFAQDALQAHLPKPWLDIADLNNIELYETKLLSPQSKKLQSDVIYKVPLKGQTGLFLFHLEHQSVPEKLMPLRIFQYMSLLLLDYAESHRRQPLPIVYPLIFYTGERPYRYSTALLDLFGKEADAFKKVLLEPIQLVDVCRMSDEEIQQHRLFGLAEYMFKHKKSPQFDAFLEVFLPWLEEVAEVVGTPYTQPFLHYILEVFSHGSYDSLVNKIAEQSYRKTGENGMTIAQELRAMGREEGFQQGLKQGKEEGMTIAQELKAMGRKEGLQQGIERGMQQGKQAGEQAAKRQLAENFLKEQVDENLIARATGLSLDEITQLKQQLFDKV